MGSSLETATELPMTGEENGRRTRRRRRTSRRPRRGGTGLLIILIILLAAAVALLAWIALDRSNGETAADAVEPVPTALVELERRDLVETETLKGTLDFDVIAAVTETRPGTITALAPEGSLLERGDVVYRLGERPAVFLLGGVPAFRTLERGVEPGQDVFQLEFNLIGLGYDPDREIALDNRFGAATTRAVMEWQRDLRTPDSGVVELGDVVFFPDVTRLGRHVVDVGTRLIAPTTVTEFTSVDQMVTLDLDTDRQDLLAEGDAVVIELPGGERVQGIVVEVGTEATELLLPDGSSAGTTVPVTIRPTGPIPPDLTNSPVDIIVVRQSRENALVAPVTALVALRGGGYAVEIRDGETTALVAVEPGLYVDGFVEIDGAGLSESMKVVVPE